MADAFIPKLGFDFLKKLSRNNNREWFLKNKHIYEEQLKLPLQQIVIELEKVMGEAGKGLSFDPKKSLFRIHRDARFSYNKDPYKTNMGAAFISKTKSKKDESPGLYLHIEPGNCFIGGGLYMPSGDQMWKIRELINEEPRAFQRIITDSKVKKYFGGLTGERLKKSPRGIAEDHPNIELLKWKQFIYIKKFKDAEFQKGNVAKLIHKEFLAMLPLIHWLNKATARR